MKERDPRPFIVLFDFLEKHLEHYEAAGMNINAILATGEKIRTGVRKSDLWRITCPACKCYWIGEGFGAGIEINPALR